MSSKHVSVFSAAEQQSNCEDIKSMTWLVCSLSFALGFFFEGVSFYLKIVTKSLKKHGNEEN
jgi:hypothetical protein